MTGGLGYIGSHVVLALLLTGRYLPIVIDNCANGYPEALKRCTEIARNELGWVILLGNTNGQTRLARTPLSPSRLAERKRSRRSVPKVPEPGWDLGRGSPGRFEGCW